MTAQEIFDTVVTHLRTQKAKSIDGDFCVYRSPTGLKCAVGCLIPDDVYHVDMEGECASTMIAARSNELGHLRDHQELLDRLQLVHDNYEIDRWEWWFVDIAETFKLIYTKISD
jgi:hypothetical protein